MGILNLISGDFTGKVGAFVGAHWKDKSTIREYKVPSYTNTPQQQVIRGGFGEINSFVALFADQIKSLSALNTKGMSVRNAIVKLNKDMVTAGSLTPADLLVSRGGLPRIQGFNPTVPSGNTGITVAWTPVSGVTISNKARVVFIAVDQTDNFAVVESALNSTGSLSITINVPAPSTIHCFAYLLDYRGSSRVASPSEYKSITVS